jgi:hypothetical protein
MKTKDGWEYQTDEYFSERDHVKVIPPEKEIKSLPNTLYKYFSINGNTIDALETFNLYGNHPYQLNDLFDCSKQQIEIDEAFVSQNPYFLEGIKREFLKHEIETKSIDVTANRYEVIKDFLHQFFFKKYAIASFTDNPLSIQMWAYYAQQNTGICVEYDYSKFPFKWLGPFQMHYRNSFEKFIFSEHPKENVLPLLALYMSLQKSTEWKNESEWRMIFEKNEERLMESPLDSSEDIQKYNQVNRLFHYENPAIIQSIYFGWRFLHNNNNHRKIEGKKGEVILDTSDENTDKLRLIRFVIQHNIKTHLVAPIQLFDDTSTSFKLKPCEIKFSYDESLPNQFVFELL